MRKIFQTSSNILRTVGSQGLSNQQGATIMRSLDLLGSCSARNLDRTRGNSVGGKKDIPHPKLPWILECIQPQGS